MNRALSQFAKISEDAKARSQAEGELAHLDSQTHVDEEKGPSGP
jgi:hypothetical protein